MQKTEVILTDDLEASAGQVDVTADETISFALEGTSYLIDLSKNNADTLRALLAPYVAAGRKARTASKGRDRSARKTKNSTDIRNWAKEQGLEISERGRIPAEIVGKYNAAH